MTGVLDTSAMVEGMLGQFGPLVGGGDISEVLDGLGDTRVVLYVSERSHLPLHTLVDMTIEAAGEKAEMHLDFAHHRRRTSRSRSPSRASSAAGDGSILARVARRRDEPVRLTRIYTRAGDAGETSLGDGSRVPKTDPRIEAYGTVDELNSLLGLVLAGELSAEFRPWLEQVQNDLFDVGADLSVPLEDERERLRVTAGQVERLEELCDLRQRAAGAARRASCSPAGRRPPRACTSRAPSAAGPSALPSTSPEEQRSTRPRWRT